MEWKEDDPIRLNNKLIKEILIRSRSLIISFLLRATLVTQAIRRVILV